VVIEPVGLNSPGDVRGEIDVGLEVAWAIGAEVEPPEQPTTATATSTPARLDTVVR
jgi:hypothetical protein